MTTLIDIQMLACLHTDETRLVIRRAAGKGRIEAENVFEPITDVTEALRQLATMIKKSWVLQFTNTREVVKTAQEIGIQYTLRLECYVIDAQGRTGIYVLSADTEHIEWEQYEKFAASMIVNE